MVDGADRGLGRRTVLAAGMAAVVGGGCRATGSPASAPTSAGAPNSPPPSVGRTAWTPGARVRAYGPAPAQEIEELGDGAVPIVLLHGGFWRNGYDVRLMIPLALDLAGAGRRVVNAEYRRVGDPGGGWPGTFDDVAAALTLVGPGAIVIGHSAGGHLAAWAAATRPDVRAVVALAGVFDLAAFEQSVALLGGGPAEVPDRYAAASPMQLPAPSVPVLCVHGERDGVVPIAESERYVERVRTASLVRVPGADHFSVIDPRHDAWRAVRRWLDERTG